MPSLRYLNVVLTVLAVLLTLHLWTLWTAPFAGSPVASTPHASPWLESEAHAQAAVSPTEQRKQMIARLQEMVQRMDQLNTMFRSGQAHVTVINASKERREGERPNAE